MTRAGRARRRAARQPRLRAQARHQRRRVGARPGTARRRCRARAGVPVGDDCAAIPDGAGGYLLFAIEGLVEDFIERMPWFAGYCGVMVNVSDIYAMGGRPIAVVDALWSAGMDPADADARGHGRGLVERYGVPIVGGHSNNRSRAAAARRGHPRPRAEAADQLRRAPRRPARDGRRPARRLRGALPLLERVDRRARPSACAATSNCCRSSPRPGCAMPPRTSAWPASSARR